MANPDLDIQPISKDELIELIRCDEIMAIGRTDPTGPFIVRNADARREYAIRVRAMRQMLIETVWLNPATDKPE